MEIKKTPRGIFNKNKALTAGRVPRGFGLLEVIIAVYIIMTGLLGAMSLVKYIVSSVAVSSSRLVALNLAQEGIEVTRSIRDRQPDWKAWYDNLADGDYMVQYSDASLPQSSDRVISQPSDNKILKYVVGPGIPSGLFFYGGSGPDSAFAYRRKITIIKAPPPDGNSDEIAVVSEVTWTVSGVTGTVSRAIKVEDRLWNWLAPVKSP